MRGPCWEGSSFFILRQGTACRTTVTELVTVRAWWVAITRLDSPPCARTPGVWLALKLCANGRPTAHRSALPAQSRPVVVIGEDPIKIG